MKKRLTSLLLTAAMIISMIVVPVVSLLTKNKKADADRVDEIFECYKEA